MVLARIRASGGSVPSHSCQYHSYQYWHGWDGTEASTQSDWQRTHRPVLLDEGTQLHRKLANLQGEVRGNVTPPDTGART